MNVHTRVLRDSIVRVLHEYILIVTTTTPKVNVCSNENIPSHTSTLRL